MVMYFNVMSTIQKPDSEGLLVDKIIELEYPVTGTYFLQSVDRVLAINRLFHVQRDAGWG
jgi:hypothetical protein